MPYLIGTDEAGYGPNLGPLVISATAWQVPDNVRADDLYNLLENTVAPSANRPGRNGLQCIAIADSKLLYQPGKGIRHLERGVLAALAALRRRPVSWREAWDALSPDSVACLDSIPWYSAYNAPLPVDDDPSQRDATAEMFADGLAASGIRLLELRSRVVFEEEFNRLIDRHGTKGETLSQLSLALVAQVVASLVGGPVSVVCDKHGGRNRYSRLISAHFPDWLVEVYSETRDLSLYRFGPPDCRTEIRFCTRAECFLPAALASMASKYLRELAMIALNEYWCGQVPGLVRTAGYPGDARRFKEAIAAIQATLGISDQAVWRGR